jgi:hypothetical protein
LVLHSQELLCDCCFRAGFHGSYSLSCYSCGCCSWGCSHSFRCRCCSSRSCCSNGCYSRGFSSRGCCILSNGNDVIDTFFVLPQ